MNESENRYVAANVIGITADIGAGRGLRPSLLQSRVDRFRLVRHLRLAELQEKIGRRLGPPKQTG